MLWIAVHRTLRKIRIAINRRDGIYRLHKLIEIEVTLFTFVAAVSKTQNYVSPATLLT